MSDFESLVPGEPTETEKKLPNPLESGEIENGTVTYTENHGYVIDLEKFFSKEGLILKKDDAPVERVILVSIDGSFLSFDRDGKEIDSSIFGTFPYIEGTSGINITVGNSYRYYGGYEYSKDELGNYLYQDIPKVVGVFMITGELGKKETDFIKSIEIPEYKPFDPVQNYKLCFYLPDDVKPSERRSVIKSNLQKFQEKLVWQKEGIGKSIEKLYNAIIENPEINFIDYLKIRNSFASEYLLTRNQLDKFDSAFSLYRERHDVVNSYFENYPDKNSLFEACFGDRPRGEIEVIKGPMFIHFRCLNMDDYSFLYSINSNSGDRRKVSVLDVERAYQTGGIAFSHGFRISDLSGCLSVERGGSQVTEKDIFGEGRTIFMEYSVGEQNFIRDHEWQHLFNALFEPAEKELDMEELHEKFEKDTSISIKEAILQSIYRLAYNTRIQSIDLLARDEILAYIKNGLELPIVLDTMLNSKNYDYRNQANKKDLVQEIVEGAYKVYAATISSKKIEKSDIWEQVDNVYGERYKKDLKIWIDAVSILEKKGFTREQVVNLLYQEPVNSWINLARRMRDRV